MFLKRGTNGVIDRVIVGHVGQRYTANFGAKTWTNLDDVHRRILRKIVVSLIFPQKWFAGKELPPHVSRAQRSTTSAFTRVLRALWWCAADPGSQLLTSFDDPGSAVHRIRA